MVVIFYLGVAQLVARYLGVVEAAGSSPVTQTISSVHNGFELWALDFFMLKQLFSFLGYVSEQVRLLRFVFNLSFSFLFLSLLLHHVAFSIPHTF